MNKGQGYKPGNKPDQIKHHHLEFLVENLLPNTYIEFHSGSGRCCNSECAMAWKGKSKKDYLGSSMRVLNILKKNQVDSTVYLHEKNKTLRERLEINVDRFNSKKLWVAVSGKWQDYSNDYIKNADTSHLFLLDPTKIADYNTGLIDFLDLALPKEANFFIYVPQTLFLSDYHKSERQRHQKIVDDIENLIVKHSRNAIDLSYHYGSGEYEKLNHDIIVADLNILSKINHAYLSSIPPTLPLCQIKKIGF